jgi:sigma-B regulation protein RsbU (phosphoserine phosphatase)
LNLVVQNVAPDGPNSASAIHRGDEILAVSGERARNLNHLRYLVSRNTSLAPQDYTLRRGNDHIVETVRYGPVPASQVYRRFAVLLVAFTFLVMAVLVLVRRGDQIGTLFALNCAILAFFLSDRPILGTTWLQLGGELLEDALILAFPATFLHFFLVFHDRPNRPHRRAHVGRSATLYLIPALLYAVGTILTTRQFAGQPTSPVLVRSILTASTVYMAIFLLSSLVIFVRNYRGSSMALRQKLRIAILGTVVGIVPFLAMIVWRQISTAPHTAWEFVSACALSFVSISFGYAILKHGVIELNIVVRKSLVYAILTGALIASYYTLANLLGDYLTNQFNVRAPYFSIVTILLLAVIFAPVTEAVQRLSDRVLFRKDYDYAQEVVEFNRQLSKKLKRSDILECFFHRTDTLLKASYTAFYSYTGGDREWIIEKVKANGYNLPAAFPRESLLGRYLTRYKRPLMVEYLDRLWGRRHLDKRSEQFLDESRAAVCVPLWSVDSLFGLAVLGPKRSGQLYTQTDSNLLERMAEHLGLVLENTALHEAALEQERLKNELLLAREIQMRLLPETPPQHARVKILGRMVTSAEVGGDYFDYFMLDDHRIGVGIGDGTGKGVPAAMLMSSLQAVFKNLALRDRLGPAELLGELNRHLCGSTRSDQFATFFYGILDTNESVFTFSNAGHCPALLCKGDYTDRLGEGGIPLGIDAAHVYQEGRVRVERGDILCLHTDGVSEQSDADGEPFAEERLLTLLHANKNLPLSELQELLFATVTTFGGGRQDDDATVIIASYHDA